MRYTQKKERKNRVLNAARIVKVKTNFPRLTNSLTLPIARRKGEWQSVMSLRMRYCVEKY